MSEIPLPVNARPLHGLVRLHHVIVWCQNGDVVVDKYTGRLGFAHVASRRDVGDMQRVEHHLRLSDSHVVVVSPTRADDTELLDFVVERGDAVKDMVFEVNDMTSVLEHLVSEGCRVVTERHTVTDTDGSMETATVTYDEVLTGIHHTLVDFTKYNGPFIPGYILEDNTDSVSSTQSTRVPLVDFIDHVAFACERGMMHETAVFYCRAFGFSRYMCDEEDDSGLEVTGASNGLVATTLALKPNTKADVFKMVIVEPADDTPDNQIRQFTVKNGNACGVQHVAFHTQDIRATVRAWTRMGTKFCTIPSAYYQLRAKQGYRELLDEPLDELEELSILADVTASSQEAYAHDPESAENQPKYILQIFTTTMSEKHSMFFELVSRHGSFGFGKGNIKALFEAVEHQQALEAKRPREVALPGGAVSESDSVSPVGGR